MNEEWRLVAAGRKKLEEENLLLRCNEFDDETNATDSAIAHLFSATV